MVDSPAHQVLVDLPVDKNATNAVDRVTWLVTATEEAWAVDSEVDSPGVDSLLARVRRSTRMELRSSASESALRSRRGVGRSGKGVCTGIGRRNGTGARRGNGERIMTDDSRCNGENHLARDCLLPRDEAAINASKKCYKCQETGHIAR